jgi:hypothetical protein
VILLSKPTGLTSLLPDYTVRLRGTRLRDGSDGRRVLPYREENEAHDAHAGSEYELPHDGRDLVDIFRQNDRKR